MLIDREETWYFLKQKVTAKGMIYFKEKEKSEKPIEEIKIKVMAFFDDLKNKFGE